MRHTLRWLASASRRDVDPTPWRNELFPEQRTFLEDPAELKAALCTRRAGKTRVNGVGLIDALISNPELPALYITRTAEISKDMLWSELSNANARYGLGLHPHISDQRFLHPSGGYIQLTGCKDRVEAEKFRGHKYSIIVIDEGGTHKPDVLKYLVTDVLSAATTDHLAPVWLTGTPGIIPAGFFWAVTTGDDPEVKPWATHRWSVRQNPHHPFGSDPEALERHRAKLGLDSKHPTWRREFCGEWALDNEQLIYLFNRDRNGWDGQFPTGTQRTILGVDLGYDDHTAFVVTTSVDGIVYVRESFGRSKMLPGDIAEAIRELRRRYEINEIYVDSGGLGKTIVEQLRRDHGLPVQAAEKQDKAGCILRVQSALAAGRIRILEPKCRELLNEWLVLPWNETRTGHRERFADHCSDAFLYAFRKHPIRDDLIVNPRAYGPENLNNKIVEDMKRAAMAKGKAGKRW